MLFSLFQQGVCTDFRRIFVFLYCDLSVSSIRHHGNDLDNKELDVKKKTTILYLLVIIR